MSIKYKYFRKEKDIISYTITGHDIPQNHITGQLRQLINCVWISKAVSVQRKNL